MYDGEEEAAKEKADDDHVDEQDRDLDFQRVSEMVPDFLEEEKEGKIDPWQDDDRVGQTSGDHAVLALVEEQGKPEVGDDVEGGGEETEEEGVEEVVPVEHLASLAEETLTGVVENCFFILYCSIDGNGSHRAIMGLYCKFFFATNLRPVTLISFLRFFFENL